ncbi:uncharacterized protein LOC129583903 [Paramacrobiotus metropolitanus]|uniref:uncharacterized protein LOC129583903 n=1 Tax=Paramacrobiotus metropolitanus TaxID=2943436 RepID=UPI0024462951|nr:uncharacterized protein LOC129583903 [Paramacrobiotus metropolitanus]
MDSKIYPYKSVPMDISALHKDEYTRIHRISLAQIIMSITGLVGTIISCLVISGEHLYTVLAGLTVDGIILSAGSYGLKVSRTYEETAWKKNKSRLRILSWFNIISAIFLCVVLILLIIAAAIIPTNLHYLDLAVREVVSANNTLHYLEQKQGNGTTFFVPGINVGDSTITILISFMVICGIFLLTNIVLSLVTAKISQYILNNFFRNSKLGSHGISITVTNDES